MHSATVQTEIVDGILVVRYGDISHDKNGNIRHWEAWSRTVRFNRAFARTLNYWSNPVSMNVNDTVCAQQITFINGSYSGTRSPPTTTWIICNITATLNGLTLTVDITTIPYSSYITNANGTGKFVYINDGGVYTLSEQTTTGGGWVYPQTATIT